MNKKLARRALALLLASFGIAGVLGAVSPPPAQRVAPAAPGASAVQHGAAPPDTTDTTNPPPPANAGNAPPQGDANKAPPRATEIMALCDKDRQRIDTPLNSKGEPPESRVGLNAALWVVVRTSDDRDPKQLQLVSGCAGLTPILVTDSKQQTQTTTPEPGSSSNSSQNDKNVAPPLIPGVGLDVADYALFLDGREVEGLEGTIYNSSAHRFEFQLTRNGHNKPLWKQLLGSPEHPYRQVTVALGVRQKDKTTQPTIEGIGKSATFQLRVFSPLWFWIAVGAVVAVFVLVIGNARTTTTLRDALLPQLPPHEQPYSLGRCQMAFWFVLVFASFVFLYVLLWDYDTVSTQALALMGISSATALAAVAVDIVKDSPADAANRALQALGINTYADVLRMRQEIVFRQPQVPPAQAKAASTKTTADQAKAVSDSVAANANATQAQKEDAAKVAKDAKDLADAADRDLKALQAEIQDREVALRTYDDKSGPFRSESWFKDITTDLNGPTVHRLQVVFWTAALGGVFLVGVYRDLSMPPDFSATLLALMGLSGAGYVGFKYPEKNN
jgi:gas vesicle protein